MFSSDRNIETIGKLCADLKAYVTLRTEALQIDFVSKLANLLSRLILGLVLFVLFAILFVLVSVIVISALAPHVGGTLWACVIMGVVYVILGAIIYNKRKVWIIDPTANYLGHLFLDNKETDNHKEGEK